MFYSIFSIQKYKQCIYIALHLSIYTRLTEKAVRNDGLGVNDHYT